MIHNALRYYADLVRGYKRILGIADDDGLERAGETLTPVMPLFELPEWAAPRGEYLGIENRLVSSVAGQYGGVGLGLAAGARELVVVEPESNVTTGSACNVMVYRCTTPQLITLLGNAGSPQYRDSRKWSIGLASAYFGTRWGTHAAVVGTRMMIEKIPASAARPVTFEAMGPLVIAAGEAMYATIDLVNAEIAVNLRFRYRYTVPSELDV